MLKDKIDKIKSLILKEDNQKKKIENLVVFVIILIITIIAINQIWKTEKKSSTTNTLEGATLAEVENKEVDNQNELEEKLENILEKINGVGKAKVMITYSQTSQTVAMYNEDISQSDTQESDTRGSEQDKLHKVQLKRKLYTRK